MRDALEHGLRPFRVSHETQADFVAIHDALEHELRLSSNMLISAD